MSSSFSFAAAATNNDHKALQQWFADEEEATTQQNQQQQINNGGNNDEQKRRRQAAIVEQVNAPDKFGLSPLMLACKNAAPESAALLLAHKADPNQKNKFGSAALHMAAMSGSVKCIRAIVEHASSEENKCRVDIEATTSAGLTPMEIAAQRGHVDAVIAFAEMGARMNPFFASAKPEKRIDIAVVLLFMQCADIKAIDVNEQDELADIKKSCELALQTAAEFREHALQVLPSAEINLTSEPLERVLEYCNLAPQYKKDGKAMPFFDTSALGLLQWFHQAHARRKGGMV